jgi:hypothetical protein
MAHHTSETKLEEKCHGLSLAPEYRSAPAQAPHACLGPFLETHVRSRAVSSKLPSRCLLVSTYIRSAAPHLGTSFPLPLPHPIP